MDKLNRFKKNIEYIQETMGLRQIANIAAATAFWFFLSIVPIVMLAVSILPYTSLSQQQLMEFIEPAVPGSVSEFIRIVVADVYRGNAAILSISILATVWSAARGFASLIRGLEDIYQQEDRAGYLLRRFRGVLYTLSMLVFMLLSIVLGGFGHQLMLLVEKYLPMTHWLFNFLLHFRFLVVIAGLTVFFTAIFCWGTGQRLPVRAALPGAAFGALGWSFLTWVFSAWVSGSSYGTYGSLATVVIVMLWLYYSQYLLLLGACINRAIPRGLDEIKKEK